MYPKIDMLNSGLMPIYNFKKLLDLQIKDCKVTTDLIPNKIKVIFNQGVLSKRLLTIFYFSIRSLSLHRLHRIILRS